MKCVRSRLAVSIPSIEICKMLYYNYPSALRWSPLPNGVSCRVGLAGELFKPSCIADAVGAVAINTMGDLPAWSEK